MKKTVRFLLLGGCLSMLLCINAQARMPGQDAGYLVTGISVAGYDQSLFLSNVSADLYPRKRWGVGADVWIWKRYDVQQVFATDFRVQRMFGLPRLGLLSLGLGFGWSGSTVENQTSDTTFSGNLTLEYKLKLIHGLWFTAGSTWMLYQDGFTAPFHADFNFRVLPRIRATIGLMGIHTFLANHTPKHTFNVRPSIGLNLIF